METLPKSCIHSKTFHKLKLYETLLKFSIVILSFFIYIHVYTLHQEGINFTLIKKVLVAALLISKLVQNIYIYIHTHKRTTWNVLEMMGSSTWM